MAFETSQGITFKFNGVTYTATSVAVSRSFGEFDVSSVDQAKGEFRRMRAGKVNAAEIKVDWLGGTIPPTRTVCPIVVEGTNVGGATEFSAYSAVCTGLTITGAAGDIIKGSATFKVSYN
jgi:hypothetical protein